MNLASARELHVGYNFNVSVDGSDSDGIKFCTFGPLQVSLTTNVYREAGATLAIKDPNEVEYVDVTLERGVSQSRLFYDWINDVIESTTGVGDGMMVNPSIRYSKDITVYQKDRTGKTLRKYHLFGAFPVQWVAGAWDAQRDEVVIERLTLAYDYFVIG